MMFVFAKIKNFVYAAIAGAVFLAGAWLYRSGASNARTDMVEDDYENAEDIRRRVSVDRADELRKLDDAGWRD